MRALLVVVLASCPFLVGCGQAADVPSPLTSPASPSDVVGSGTQAAKAPAVDAVEVPFHSEVTWTKAEGSITALCTHTPPAGTVYLQRNTITGEAISTHLGKGEYEGHTCVYGTPPTTTTGPIFKGWIDDVRWTAANGDVLLAVSEFQRWTGAFGASTAIEKVTFLDGGTGRFQYAEGEGMSYVDAPGKTALYDGTLRYGKKQK
jgi:hypothetical protein